MAARRLAILVMLLIGISMAITVVSQPLREQRNRERAATTTSSTRQPVAPRKPANDSARSERLNGPKSGEQVILIEPGTNPLVRTELRAPVVLVVKSPRPAQISIPALGLSGFADQYAPARFALLPRRTGRFLIDAAPGGVAGVLLVTETGRGKNP